jgi:hypothetical protein
VPHTTLSLRKKEHHWVGTDGLDFFQYLISRNRDMTYSCNRGMAQLQPQHKQNIPRCYSIRICNATDISGDSFEFWISKLQHIFILIYSSLVQRGALMSTCPALTLVNVIIQRLPHGTTRGSRDCAPQLHAAEMSQSLRKAQLPARVKTDTAPDGYQMLDGPTRLLSVNPCYRFQRYCRFDPIAD